MWKTGFDATTVGLPEASLLARGSERECILLYLNSSPDTSLDKKKPITSAPYNHTGSVWKLFLSHRVFSNHDRDISLSNYKILTVKGSCSGSYMGNHMSLQLTLDQPGQHNEIHKKRRKSSQLGQCTPVIPALARLRQDDHYAS